MCKEGGGFTQRKMDEAIQVERRWWNIDEKAEGRYVEEAKCVGMGEGASETERERENE